ncbi:unnamed protein product [Rotaria sp. Silwood2]|nr:unnamed protein product [Rotaria sp. Silwood2]CAF2511748.1 unnamed protein product [Rotaria sp. Silwood2]CAF2888339.1 unnamed protein product [Rotaria sp. Silwood2]CAF3938438.1 unnamed protein product [Rotaria sp. Silwood2]CAF4237452.1 unnamed protein product [Rotaria sp. Silwood2]
MASQSGNLLENETTNDFIDFDQVLYSPNGFHNEYENLNLSESIGVLNTPTFEMTNPSIQLTQEQHFNDNNNISVADFQEPLSMSIDQGIFSNSV